MILPVFRLVRDRVAATVARLYDLPADDPAIAEMSIEIPPKRALGDIAVPIAFVLARRLRKAPRVTAQEIAGALGPLEGVARVDVAPNGYLNLFLDRAHWVHAWTADRPQTQPVAGKGGKTIVEHTAINPNKAAHIGHLRNAALGDAFGRLLRFQGRQVEIQNYIDDTGVQVADVVVGFQQLEQKSLADVRAIAASGRFDYYCWDLYARVTEWYEQDKERLRDPRRRPARHRARRQRHCRARRLHRRAHRRLPPANDEADEHRLRPVDVGRRHPAPALLGARLRFPEEDRRSLPADRGQAGRLLGDEDRGRRHQRRRRTRGRRAEGESHRPLGRHGDLRRQGHGVADVEVRSARPRLLLSPLREGRVVDDLRPGG